MAGPVFQHGQQILFIGDSITDCGCRGEAAPYGNGYVGLTRALLLARYPGHNLEVVNHGISGNTIRDLDKRWERDVIAVQPDWLSIKIGINDVWRTITGRHDEAVPLDEYAATYDRLLKRTKEATNARLILMEPYVIDRNRQDPFRSLIDQYVGVVHQMAVIHDAILVRTQAAFDEVLVKQPTSFWANDRVHPNAPGHAVIARTFLLATGYSLG